MHTDDASDGVCYTRAGWSYSLLGGGLRRTASRPTWLPDRALRATERRGLPDYAVSLLFFGGRASRRAVRKVNTARRLSGRFALQCTLIPDATTWRKLNRRDAGPAIKLTGSWHRQIISGTLQLDPFPANFQGNTRKGDFDCFDLNFSIVSFDDQGLIQTQDPPINNGGEVIGRPQEPIEMKRRRFGNGLRSGRHSTRAGIKEWIADCSWLIGRTIEAGRKITVREDDRHRSARQSTTANSQQY